MILTSDVDSIPGLFFPFWFCPGLRENWQKQWINENMKNAQGGKCGLELRNFSFLHFNFCFSLTLVATKCWQHSAKLILG